MHRPSWSSSAISGLLVSLVLLAGEARAHCDALDGPVVRDARIALDRGDPAPILKWVSPEREADIRAAFRDALAVRSAGGKARELADRHFFETLVRIHRAGEGEGFTGLKPAGTVDPGIAAADRALEAGAVAPLSRQVADAIAEGVTRRFRRASELRRKADGSVEAGRAYVAAYVDYIHFVEEADRLARRGAPHVHHDEPAHQDSP